MNIDEIVNGFLEFLKARKLDYLLPEILEKLDQHLESREDTAYVTSAVELREEEKKRLQVYLKKNFGYDLKIKLIVDPEILGGIKIVVGDRLIDQTIAGRLNTLKEEIV